MVLEIQIQTDANHLNKYYSWPAVVFIQVVCIGLYIFFNVISFMNHQISFHQDITFVVLYRMDLCLSSLCSVGRDSPHSSHIKEECFFLCLCNA